MNPLLSVIVPVYNVESYLDRCVQSILSQRYQNLELILIDDGSTDDSSLLCDEWAKRDSRIHIIHKKNGGVSSARNVGLKMSHGDYLTFVDPDDFIASETYLMNMEYLIGHSNVDMLQYPYCNFVNDDLPLDYHKPSSSLVIGTEQIFRNWWSGSPLEFTTCNKIYKRDLWNGVCFNVGHVSEDTCLVAIFSMKARYVFISEWGLYYYQRNRENSYTYEYNFEKHIDLFYAHADIYECFKFFPDMVTEKVIAFTRLYRRLITALQTNPDADVSIPKKMITRYFPTWLNIIASHDTEKIWLSTAKVLGPTLFIKFFLKYLKSSS